MAKTKVTTAVPDVAPKRRLNAEERMSLVLAQSDLQMAQLAEKHVTAVLRAQELEAHIALTQTRKQQDEAKANITQAEAKHKRLTDELAERYGFDWQTSSFEPQTGEIVDLPTTDG